MAQVDSSFAAIILTHSHLDHYGLAHHAHPAIAVYGSRGTLAILEVGRVFFPRAAQPADLRLLPDGEPLHFGPLTVTGISVDHSAPDSRALLVEAAGRTVLSAADLRAHGRSGFRFETQLADPRLLGVDWLLLVDTTLSVGSGGRAGRRGARAAQWGRPAAADHGLRSEQDVEEALVTLARESRGRLMAVVASGQTLDRLVSCFRAAKCSGRQLIIDAYQVYVLMKLAPLSPSLPQFTWRRAGQLPLIRSSGSRNRG